MTAHIAEVYFRAWKKATGEVQEQIESSCIQDFMQSAILLHRTSPVHAKVRQVDVRQVDVPPFCRYPLNVLHSLAGCELFPLQEGRFQGGPDALSSL